MCILPYCVPEMFHLYFYSRRVFDFFEMALDVGMETFRGRKPAKTITELGWKSSDVLVLSSRTLTRSKSTLYQATLGPKSLSAKEVTRLWWKASSKKKFIDRINLDLFYRFKLIQVEGFQILRIFCRDSPRNVLSSSCSGV